MPKKFFVGTAVASTASGVLASLVYPEVKRFMYLRYDNETLDYAQACLVWAQIINNLDELYQ